MRDVLSSIMRSQRTAPVPTVPPAPTRKKRPWKPALLLLGGAVLGAAPFLLQLWGGKQSRKLSFEHAFAIAKDPGVSLQFSQTAWGRIAILCEDGFGALHTVRRQRPAFQAALIPVFSRISSLLLDRELARKKRPNLRSFADALAGILDSRNSKAEVQACIDLIAFDLEESIRALQVRRRKGGVPGDSAALLLSWFRRFLDGK